MPGLDISAALHDFSILALPIVVAITFHEAAHGYVAWRLGDDTAYRLGRVSFNPLRHIDPFGTVVLPLMLFLGGGILFGYAKPVPVRFGRLAHPRRDSVLVAAAGPIINLLLALVSAGLIHLALLLPDWIGYWVISALSASIYINVLLAIFNLIPLPPLDGGRVAVGLLPPALGRRLAQTERWGLLILMAGLFILPWIGSKLGLDLNIFAWLVGRPAAFIEELILAATGLA